MTTCACALARKISMLATLAFAAAVSQPMSPLVPGIHKVSATEVFLCLEAPGKTKVHAVGDFNQWTPSAANQMTREGDKFWIRIGNLTSGKEYIFQYWIDDAIKIGDPYGDKIVDYAFDPEIIKDGVYPGLIPYTRQYDGLATVFTAGLPAATTPPRPFAKPAAENLLVYETLIRDFVKTHSFKELRDSLAYFKRLGVNAIQLMPVMEFENNNGWGYSPSYVFAVDKYYGPAVELKALVQAAHDQGLAVILDIVLNHAMGQHPLIQMYWDKAGSKVETGSPFANVTPRHDYSVGFDLNYESAFTRSYYKKVLQYWIREYVVDGFRIDLSKGLTQKNTLGDIAAWGRLDPSRVAILLDLQAAAREADPEVLLILEHFADNEEEKLLSSKGFLLWGNSSFDHGHAVEGRTQDDFDWAYFRNRTWADSRLVTYMESHDEERVVARALENGLNSGGYDVRNLATALERAKLAALFLFGIPGPKMMWQFGEWGDGRAKGVTAEERMAKKPLPEDYRLDPARIRLWNAYSSLLHFRGQHQAAFKDGAFAWKPDGAVRNWKLSHASLNAFAVGNFSIAADKAVLNLAPGTWYSFFSRERFTLAGPVEIPLRPGEFHLFVDRPLFGNLAGITDFTVPKALNPEAVPVSLGSEADVRNGLIRPAIRRNGNGAQTIQTNSSVHDMTGRKIPIP